MILRIEHITHYTYSSPVVLEPHTLRLRPRADTTQHLIQHDMQVQPEASGMSPHIDHQGNHVITAWFVGPGSELVITTHSVVKTLRKNPYDFIYTDEATRTLPARYQPHVYEHLARYLNAPGPASGVARFAAGIMNEQERRTEQFLPTLAARIGGMIEHEVRHEGPPMSSDELLKTCRGACRDMTVLFVESCRAVGLAARFVSGYTAPLPQHDAEMHAWAEVYLPGGGWRGFDPTLGLAVTDRHVAAASRPEDAAPVTGVFSGAGATATMNVDLRVEAVTEAVG